MFFIVSASSLAGNEWLLARPVTTALTVSKSRKTVDARLGRSHNLDTTLHLFDFHVVAAARRLEAALRNGFALPENGIPNLIAASGGSSAPPSTQIDDFMVGGMLDGGGDEDTELTSAPMPLSTCAHLAYNFLSFLLPWTFEPGFSCTRTVVK